MQVFLKAKHWQLFLLTTAIPVLMQMIITANMFGSLISGQAPVAVFSYFKYYPLIGIPIMGVMFGWFWAIAAGLQGKIPDGTKINLKWFKISFWYCVAYLPLFCAFMWYMMASLFTTLTPPPFGMGATFFLIMPLHMLATFGLFYCMYIVAKIVKTVELQRPAGFGEFAAEFFMIWFYFIGVWMIQPRVNDMIKPGYQPPIPPWLRQMPRTDNL